MTKIRRKLYILIAILSIIVFTMSISIYRGFSINPNNLQINYSTLSSNKIPKEMNDVSIVYFTDLQFGKYQNEERTKKVFDKIKYLDPDIIIFGGDLYDTSATITLETNNLLTKYFTDIHAPLGKFAILGEKDIRDESRINTVKTIFSNSQFEIIKDTNVHLGNQSKLGVRLIGLSPNPNYKKAFNGINSKEFNILLSHKPDAFNNPILETKSISYGMAGHSHGTQITFPIKGGYQTIKGAKVINCTNKKTLSFPYIISSGVGCTNINARLNATPSIEYYLLSSK